MEKSNGWLNLKFSNLLEVLAENKHEDVMHKLFIKMGLYTDQSKECYAPMDSFVREELTKFYKPHSEKLQTITGLDHSSWNA